MRWDNLRIDREEERALPGYRDAVVRTFDAPEGMDIRFWEVRARSALNRVPERSRVPFRWTVNPYRGCTHACTYCLRPGTPVLMADGRTKPIAELRVGDEIYGTRREGDHRRLARTRVLAHWRTSKPAYRVTLADGTELVASGDHRFLTSHGWRHVASHERGPDRAHLTLNDQLLGTGKFARPPLDSADYRRGYLCGLIRGDGHAGTHLAFRRNGREARDHELRLALADLEALRRARDYLGAFAVETDELRLTAAGAGPRAITAIRTQARDRAERIRELVEWPLHPTPDWCKGFLAGLFDAEGHYGRDGVLRIASADPAVLGWASSCLRTLGFSAVREDHDGGRPMAATIRIRGGLREHLRFFQTVDPAITRKRSLEGRALKAGGARLQVASIERLPVELPMYDITTGTGDFIADGVVSHNCFARPTHRYLDLDPGRDFEREIVVKVNVPEVLRAELARPSWRREHVALGTNTDPYQWVESRYRLMPGIWEAFRDFETPCSILTKSPLLLRDLPLLQQVAERVPVTASFSVPTVDEKAWRQTEPHTPNPRARLEAVAELNRAGIPCGILIAPLMPGINDAPEQVEEILELAAEAGAVSVGGITLHLRGEVRDVFFDWLRSQRPDLVPRYEQLYGRGAYAPPAVRHRHDALIRGNAGRRALPEDAFAEVDGRAPPRRRARDRPPPARPGDRARTRRTPPPSFQPTLF